METKWSLSTSDGHTIYGVKNAAENPSRKALFLVHGLTGHVYEYQHKRAADFFVEKGYDVYRLGLYWDEPGGRRLIDTTIQIHAQDLTEVTAHFGKNYDAVYCAGHSYGGATVAMANVSGTKALSLWDPTFNPKDNILADFRDDYLKGTGCYAVKWHVTTLIGQEMYKEAQRLDEEACLEFSAKIKTPVQIVFAKNGNYVQQEKSWDSAATGAKERVTIPDTTHCFYEGDSCEKLLAATYAWFERW